MSGECEKSSHVTLNHNKLNVAWQHGCHVSEILKFSFFYEIFCISIQSFTGMRPKGPFYDKSALVQLKAFCPYSRLLTIWTINSLGYPHIHASIHNPMGFFFKWSAFHGKTFGHHILNRPPSIYHLELIKVFLETSFAHEFFIKCI